MPLKQPNQPLVLAYLPLVRIHLKNCQVARLDYTDLKFERFDEFQRLLRQVLPRSIVRITLRAEPEINIRSLEDKLSEDEYLRLKDELVRDFTQEFDRILPPGIDIPDAFEKPNAFAQLVQSMAKIAASQALDSSGSEVDYLPVQCTRYSDNTQMVSITGVVCNRTEMSVIREKLKSIRFATFDWNTCSKIDVPTLTVKERLHLERYLPIQDNGDAGEVLYNALDYKIDNGAPRSKRQLSHYAECHRSYPNFVQVSI